MSRLELVQRVFLEAGLAGSGPTSTIDQVGEAAQIVGYVDEAWLTIQQMRKWRWMWELVTLTLEADAQTIEGEGVPADRYLTDTAYIDTAPLSYIEWDVWRMTHPSITNTGTPCDWTVRPDNTLQFSSIASADTIITVERFANPTVMTADEDEPVGLKGEHHMLIVWQAVMLYAGFDEASNLYAHAKAQRKLKLMAVTQAEGALNMRMGGPLA